MLRAITRVVARPVRRSVAFMSFVLAAVSGYYGLAASGAAGTWLRVIAALGALVLTGSLLEATAVDRIRTLRRQVIGLRADIARERESYEQQISTYTRAIERITTREKALYTDKVHLTIEIGADAAGDRITEQHVTTPRPFLPYRTLSLIVPTDRNSVSRVSDLDLVWEAAGRPVNFDVLPIVEIVGKTRILLVFYPGIGNPLEWEISYRPRGLWDPLRRTGSDYLAWDTRAPDFANERFLSQFSVSFVFPSSNSRVAIQGNRGTATDAISLPTGQWQIDWTDHSPDPVRYTWDIVSGRPNDGH